MCNLIWHIMPPTNPSYNCVLCLLWILDKRTLQVVGFWDEIEPSQGKWKPKIIVTFAIDICRKRLSQKIFPSVVIFSENNAKFALLNLLDYWLIRRGQQNSCKSVYFRPHLLSNCEILELPSAKWKPCYVFMRLLVQITFIIRNSRVI